MLDVLIVDPRAERRQRLKKHLEQRFSVRSTMSVRRATDLYHRHAPHGIVASFEQEDGLDGIQFCAGLSRGRRRTARMVYGPAGLSDLPHWSDYVEAIFPHDMDHPLMEALIWQTMVDVHYGEDNRKDVWWRELIDSEPNLQNIRRIIEAAGKPVHTREHLLRLKKVLHTEVQLGASGLEESPPEREEGRFAAVFLEPSLERRTEIHDRLGERFQLLFPDDVGQARTALMRFPVACVVIRIDPGASVPREIVTRAMRQVTPFRPAVIVFGSAAAASLTDADVALPHDLDPKMVEVLLWEQLERVSDELMKGPQKPALKVRVARISTTKIAGKMSWSELLTAEASLRSLKRLLRKQIELPDGPTRASAHSYQDVTWSELLKSEANVQNLGRLMQKEIRLFQGGECPPE